MTTFEIIILTIIYLICYGYTLAHVIKEENVLLRIFLAIISPVLVIYAPVIIGGMLFYKLNGKA